MFGSARYDELNPFYGKSHSPESIAKMKLNNKSNLQSVKDKISKSKKVNLVMLEAKKLSALTD